MTVQQTPIIKLNNLGKRFNKEWIFKHINYSFFSGKKYAIIGSNGSGKSTILQVIAGSTLHNQGNVEIANTVSEKFYTQLSIAAPYLDLVEEMTANEMLIFHQAFKTQILPIHQILEIVGLSKAANKQIRYFSSGMKQRLKLAQAFFSSTPILLLDEPTSNLDTEGVLLYHQLIKNYTNNKLLIICSNDEEEYNFCDEILNISQYKI